MKYRYKHYLMRGMFFLLLSYGSTSVAAEFLRFNPFEKPDMEPDMLQGKASNKNRNTLKLRGTVIDGKDSMVNIDGKFYRLDQDVSGYRVSQIESGKVILMRGVNETVLTLSEDQ